MAEIGRLRKNETTEVVVQKTEFHGSVGIDVREYVTSERYTGWSKNGIRIPVEKWQDFKEILDKVDNADKADNVDKADKVDKVDTVKKVDSAER
jgi:ABC-type Mn2+/Zn2+ transport system ATPase subunit